jgi:hypothetical protein
VEDNLPFSLWPNTENSEQSSPLSEETQTHQGQVETGAHVELFTQRGAGGRPGGGGGEVRETMPGSPAQPSPARVFSVGGQAQRLPSVLGRGLPAHLLPACHCQFAGFYFKSTLLRQRFTRTTKCTQCTPG